MMQMAYDIGSTLYSITTGPSKLFLICSLPSLENALFLKSLFYLFVCMHMGMQVVAEEGIITPRTEVTSGCALPHVSARN